MSLLQNVNTVVIHEEALIDSMLLREFFDSEGCVVQESVGSFVAASKKLVDELHIAGVDHLKNHIASQEEIDRLNRFATILAGLEYFRTKNVGPDQRAALLPVLDDKELTNYVKKMGTERASEIIDKIKSHFFKGKIVNREAIDKMIEDIRKFYIVKKANVGTLLHVSHQDIE